MEAFCKVLSRRINKDEHLRLMIQVKGQGLNQLVNGILELAKPHESGRDYFELYWRLQLSQLPLDLVRAIYLVIHYYKALNGFFINGRDSMEVKALVVVVEEASGGSQGFDFSNPLEIINGLPI